MNQWIAVWFFLLLLSALFSSMEMVSMGAGKIEYLMSKRKKGVLYFVLDHIYSNYRNFMSFLALGNFFVLILFFFVSLEVFSPIIARNTTSVAGQYAITTLISSLVLVMSGELLPRMISSRNPGLWMRILSLPTFLIYILLSPLVRLFLFVGKSLLAPFDVKINLNDKSPLSQIQFEELIRRSIDDISEDLDVDSEVKILKNALEFSKVRIRDCMVPRTEIVAISEDAELDTLKELFIESGISRVLVYRNDIDNVLGYIHVWEMFNKTEDWTKNIAELSFVPESMPADILMNELMQEHKSIAVVVDEFGGTSGVITIEDLVEEIFGEIEDEYDSQEKFIKKEDDGTYILSGRVEVDTLNEALGITIPESEEYSTVAGYLLNHTQRFPKTYETIQVDNYKFKILKVTARKIEVVKMEILL